MGPGTKDVTMQSYWISYDNKHSGAFGRKICDRHQTLVPFFYLNEVEAYVPISSFSPVQQTPYMKPNT